MYVVVFSSLLLSYPINPILKQTFTMCLWEFFFAASFRRSHGWKKNITYEPMSFVSTLPLPRASIWDGKTVIMKTSNSHPATGRARSCSFFTPTTMRTRTNRSTSSTSSTRSNSTSWWDADSNNWNWGSLPKWWGEGPILQLQPWSFCGSWLCCSTAFRELRWWSLVCWKLTYLWLRLMRMEQDGWIWDLVHVGAEGKGVLQWIFHLSWEPRLLSLETSRWLEIHVAQRIFGLLEMWPLKQITWAVFASCMAYSISRLL